jgi:hypothetical protein
MQKSIFKIHGYHKELFDQHTGKYLGFIKMSVPDRSEAKFGYFGRTKQHVKGKVHQSNKTFDVDGVYVTECIPICGRIIADNVAEQHKVLQEHYTRTSAMRQNKS